MPGLQRQLPLQIGFGCRQLSVLRVMCGQVLKCLRHLPVILLLLYQAPFRKGRTIGKAEAGEELSAIEGHGLFESSGAGTTCVQAAVAMSVAGCQQPAELQRIHPDIAGRVKLNGIGRHWPKGYAAPWLGRAWRNRQRDWRKLARAA